MSALTIAGWVVAGLAAWLLLGLLVGLAVSRFIAIGDCAARPDVPPGAPVRALWPSCVRRGRALLPALPVRPDE
jgi:hypothetical protein